MNCKKHPKYKGIKPPQVDCKECLMVWELRLTNDPKKFITGLAKLVGFRVPVISKEENPLYHGKKS